MQNRAMSSREVFTAIVCHIKQHAVPASRWVVGMALDEKAAKLTAYRSGFDPASWYTTTCEDRGQATSVVKSLVGIGCTGVPRYGDRPGACVFAFAVDD